MVDVRRLPVGEDNAVAVTLDLSHVQVEVSGRKVLCTEDIGCKTLFLGSTSPRLFDRVRGQRGFELIQVEIHLFSAARYFGR